MSDSIDYGMLVEEEPVRRPRFTAIVDETEVGSKWWGDVDVGDHNVILNSGNVITRDIPVKNGLSLSNPLGIPNCLSNEDV